MALSLSVKQLSLVLFSSEFNIFSLLWSFKSHTRGKIEIKIHHSRRLISCLIHYTAKVLCVSHNTRLDDPFLLRLKKEFCIVNRVEKTTSDEMMCPKPHKTRAKYMLFGRSTQENCAR